MSRLKKLETKKLISELEFIMSDFDYKNEVIGEVDGDFLSSVNEFLSTHPQLKEIYDKKVNEKIDKMIKQKEDELEELFKSEELINNADENNSESDLDTEEEYLDTNDDVIKKSDKIKKLYREVVKLTHPDKVNNKKFNDLYIKSTEFYDKNDLAGIYSICDFLGIEYELDVEDNILISDKISKLKERIGFMESTFTFKWYYSKNDSEKSDIILSYIKMQLI